MHQLGLFEWGSLEVQPPQRAFEARERMVRLHKLALNAIGRELRLPEGFCKETAFIPDAFRMNEDNAVKLADFLECGHSSP
jgi:hypothetical protein